MVQVALVGFDEAGRVYEVFAYAGRDAWNDAWGDFVNNAFPSIKWKLYTAPS